MDWLQFISSIVGAVVWPATVILAFFLFKKHFPTLFPFIERLKYKDFELEFRKSLQELTEKSKSALPAPALEELPISDNLRGRLYDLAEISPRSAVLEAWLQVESAAADAIQRLNLTPNLKGALAPLRLAEYLHRGEVLDSAQMEIFHRLRELRNRAIHIGEAVFRSDEVLEYVDLALSMATKIRQAQER
jgi:hypothetical protein